jgi:hypothetical protein
MASPLLSSPGPLCGTLAFLVLFLSAEIAPARAAPPCPPSSTSPALQGAVTLSPTVAALPLAEGWSIGKLWSGIRAGLGNRRRMLQVATIGMCIGLYIMMRK